MQEKKILNDSAFAKLQQRFSDRFERVAEALLTLQEKYKGDLHQKFSIHMSREDLANIAGTATES